MPTAFLQPDSRLLRACEESTVLTSNERLRRELVRAYDARQQKDERRAWRSANVFSFEGYLSQLYHLLQGQQPHIPRLLSAEAELLLFAQLAPEHAVGLSRTALQAWNLVHAWTIPLTPSAFAHTDNGRVFLPWAERVREHLTATASLTRSELPGFLLDQPGAQPSEQPRSVVCLGFESLTRAASDYFDALEQRGVSVEFRSARDTEPGMVARSECPSTATELSSIAQWCRGILKSSSRARIGVVIPDLTNRYHQVLRQFGAELERFAHAGIPETFDVAAGLSLLEQPIWRAAQRFLELCVGRLPTDAVPALLASRYLDLPGPLVMNPELPTELTLWQLAAIVEHPLLAQLNRMCPPAQTHDTFTAWITHFSTLLDTAGWSGRGAHSGQYQAWEQLRSTMDRAAAGPGLDFTCTAAFALSLLQQTLDARVFAPRTAAAPVQVMGYLETTGLRFTHLWIAGMQDTAWPAPVTPNPFIPLSTQQRHEIPRIDQRTELEFAQNRLTHWLGSSNQVVFSHVVDDGQAQHLPSPLTAGIAATPIASLVKHWRAQSHPFLVSRAEVLEPFDDDSGSALSAGRHRGGSSLLRDQAACPFRAWAIHRLGLREIRGPHGFPDAMDRGNLVHEALHRLLAPSVEDEAAPRHPNDLAHADVVAAAEEALQRHYRRFPNPFRDREQDRLIALLSSWIEFEAQRAEFQVVDLESDAELEVAGLTLRLRLDRVDRIGDRLLIIDYKTGRPRPRGLVTSRLLEPQLPAYAVSRDGVAAVLFAQVDDTRPRLAGLVDSGVDLPLARLEPLPGANWAELVARWRDQLQVLAEEFKAGHAAVTPVEPDTCAHCHLQALCRVQAGGLKA